MAGIRLEWAQFGDFDSFEVIRSSSSMAGLLDEDLPSPLATNLSKMYFVDTLITLNAEYYYIIRTWKDGNSQISDEISIQTPKAFSITTKFRNIYAKNEVLSIPITIDSIDNVDISTSSVVSGSLPMGLSLSLNEITGTITTDGSYSFGLEVVDNNGRSLTKIFDIQVQGSIVVNTQFDTTIDKIDGTWTLGGGNSLVSNVIRKNGLKTLRLGNGTAVATAVATFSKLPPRTIWNGDYTVCGWIKRHATMTAQKLWKYGNTGSNTDRDSIQFTAQKSAQLYRNSSGSIMNLSGSYAGSKSLLDEWIHVAEVRKNNVAYLFIDGQLIATKALSESISVDRNFMLGGLRASGVMIYTDPLWIDEIKVYQGVGLWTADYDTDMEW
ncbi:LamG-like jellyroll fold domain-containing protein [Acinetobacter sp. YH12025]|uniref:LamG-like jellyroll fold domain-containing protein n=1 Tax=Acinetobacter sp. YH12025 TaxID=2601042 RepID=UPI0015D26851|nr:LamG-like jellyroll fold domain-containing protein [Acinetobacter sp. YH12025]